MSNKRCSKCKQAKPVSEFYRRRLSPDGLNARCKSCCNEDHSAYVENNREAINKANARSYRRYAEARRSKQLAYRETNYDEVTDAVHLSRARKLGAECTEHEACRKGIQKRAVYGMDMGHCRIKGPRCLDFVTFEESHLDHIIPYATGGKHCWYNVQTSCPPCNRWKHVKVLETKE